MSTGEVFGLGYRVLRVSTFLILIFPLMSFSVALKKKETQLWVDSIKKSMQTCGMSHHAKTKCTLVSFLDLNVEVLGPSEMVLGDDGSGECIL